MDYTLFLPKHFKNILLIVCIFLSTINIHSQTIVKEFYPDSLKGNLIPELKNNYGNKKTLPMSFENQYLIALSYFPELKNVKIKFRLKNKISPLSTRPLIRSIFRNAKKRTYLITISKKSILFLDPIILQNLNFNAQIGVLGHELSHVADFSSKNFWGMSKVLLGHISKKQIDHFEFNTDRICIDHGLGYQLLAWSNNVRESLKIKGWQGADNLPPNNEKERYMNPSTIINILSTHSLYQKK